MFVGAKGEEIDPLKLTGMRLFINGINLQEQRALNIGRCVPQ